MSSIAIIEDSKKVFAVQVDYRAYDPFHVVGKAEMPPETVLAATGGGR